MMKHFILIMVIGLQLHVAAQSVFTNAFKELSTQIANRMTSISKKNIAVIDLTEINKAQSTAGRYMAELISTDLANDPANFKLHERQNLDKIMSEIKLSSEGYVDEASAQRLGKLTGAEVIVSGNYTVLSNKISVTLKIIETETGLLVGAAEKDIPLDNDARTLLGLNSDGARGFNGPVQQGENYNNPETVSADCKIKDFGDICFENKGSYTIALSLVAKNKRNTSMLHYNASLSLAPGESKCSYMLPTDAYDYYENYHTQDGQWAGGMNQGHGEVLVEQCKSKTLVIR